MSIYGYSIVVQKQDPDYNTGLEWRAVVIGDAGREFAESSGVSVVFAYGETEREALHAVIDKIPFGSEQDEVHD